MKPLRYISCKTCYAVCKTILLTQTTSFRLTQIQDSPKVEFDKTEYFYMRRFAIWYTLYNFRNVKNTHGEVILLVILLLLDWKLQLY